MPKGATSEGREMPKGAKCQTAPNAGRREMPHGARGGEGAKTPDGAQRSKRDGRALDEPTRADRSLSALQPPVIVATIPNPSLAR